MKFRFCGVLAVAVGLVGCSDAPVFTLTNNSAVLLTNVVISGNGFSHPIARLAAGEHAEFIAHPDRDTGVQVDFDTDDRSLRVAELGYVQPRSGYRAAVTVEPDFTTTVTSALRPY